MRHHVPDAPPVVARYLERALARAARSAQRVTLRQAGELRFAPRSDRWMPFTATEQIDARRVAFAWDARVGLPLGIRLRIRDAYDGGTGRGSVRLGPIPLAHEEGSGDLGAAALLRLLAEAPWCPMLLVRRDVLRWRAVGTDRALATLVDHGCTAEIEFRFDEAGDVGSAYSAARPRRTRSGYVATPWEGRFRDYREADGLRIPFAGEVGWYEGSAWACVWRGRVVEARLADEGMPSAATA